MTEPRPWSLVLPSCEPTPVEVAHLPWDRVRRALAAIESGAVANATEGRRVGHVWLRAPHLAPEGWMRAAIEGCVDDVLRLADQVHRGEVRAEAGPFTHVLQVGIGGSALGPQLLVDAVRGRRLPVRVVDTLDPDGLADALRWVGDALRTTLVVVVTKSGTTIETLGGLDVLAGALREAGVDPGRHLVGVTMPDSPLHARARREGWLAVFPQWEWVGGRFASTSAAGLFPLALSGGDVRALLAGAAAMDAWTRSALDSPALQLAGLWWRAAQDGRNQVALVPYAERLVFLPRFVQQLIMESLGKPVAGRLGLVIYGHKGSTDQHAILQHLQEGPDEALTVLVQVLGTDGESQVPGGARAGDELQALLLGSRRALQSAGRPVAVLTVPKLDAYVIGGLVACFEGVVAALGELSGLNAFDQPGVEAGKRASREVIAARDRLMDRLSDVPRTAAELVDGLHVDPVEIAWLLDRAAATGRAEATGEGGERRWRTPRG